MIKATLLLVGVPGIGGLYAVISLLNSLGL